MATETTPGGTQQLEVGEGALTRAAQLVAAARQDFDRMSRELDGQIAGLRGRWAGAGGEAFFALHLAWTERQGRVVAALDGFEDSLVGTGRDLAATDTTQAAGFAGFQGRLG
jgi:WXG100 family type VII secretion target